MEIKEYLKDQINQFAFSNIRFLKNKPKGVLLRLRGLCLDVPLIELTREGRAYAKEDILFIYPYTAPWSWMNEKTVDLIDNVLDTLYESAQIASDTPLVCYGHSLGGYGALVYGAFGRYSPVASISVCPICDLNYHAIEHQGILVSMYYAFCHMDKKLDEVMFVRSPINMATTMPRIPYYIVSCDRDKQVASDKHALPLVEKLEKNGHKIHFLRTNGEHCEIPPEMEKEIFEFICNSILEGSKS